MNQQLGQLLRQQHDTASHLLRVLELESQAVIHGDMEQLQQVGTDKEQCCRSLTDLEQSWPAPLRGPQANEWLKGQNEEINRAWSALIDQLWRCRRRNDANGLLIAEQQQRVSNLLHHGGNKTYGAGGQHEMAGTSTWAASA